MSVKLLTLAKSMTSYKVHNSSTFQVNSITLEDFRHERSKAPPTITSKRDPKWPT